MPKLFFWSLVSKNKGRPDCSTHLLKATRLRNTYLDHYKYTGAISVFTVNILGQKSTIQQNAYQIPGLRDYQKREWKKSFLQSLMTAFCFCSEHWINPCETESVLLCSAVSKWHVHNQCSLLYPLTLNGRTDHRCGIGSKMSTVVQIRIIYKNKWNSNHILVPAFSDRYAACPNSVWILFL